MKMEQICNCYQKFEYIITFLKNVSSNEEFYVGVTNNEQLIANEFWDFENFEFFEADLTGPIYQQLSYNFSPQP